jgi:hypothetical protein
VLLQPLEAGSWKLETGIGAVALAAPARHGLLPPQDAAANGTAGTRAGACYHRPPMAKRTPDSDDLRKYAVVGAEQRLLEIAQEAANIFRTFPELRERGFMQDSPAEAQQRAPEARTPQRRRRQMSAAERRSVSLRMKKYWAERRKRKG